MTHIQSAMAPHTGSDDPILAIVVGDFSREATLRFWTHVSALEQRYIRSSLPSGAAFYDEYRRISYCLLGDLPFIKKCGLCTSSLLDDRILIGFPGGMTIADVLPRIGLLIFHALWGPAQRNIRHVWILFPCNTLAPLSWELERIFRSRDRILDMVAAAGLPIGDAERRLADQIAEQIRPAFPTIPEAVIESVWASKKSAFVPLGTLGIAETYAHALHRLQVPLQLIAPDSDQQNIVIQAIKSYICEETEKREAARHALIQVVDRLTRQHGDGMAVIQACTDLTCGIGLDSNAIFAESLVASVYSGFRNSH